METRTTDPLARITEYLSAGGLHNPELMEHAKVRDLLIDCRNEIQRLQELVRFGERMKEQYDNALLAALELAAVKARKREFERG